VGDANVFTTFSGSWFKSIIAQNINTSGIVEAYARTSPPDAGGLAIYEGEDFWFTFGPSSHLRLVFDNMLAQTWNPDGLPSTSSASNITLSPGSQTVPIGNSATVTALVTDLLGNPQTGIAVKFSVLSGPASGLSGTASTTSSGTATFSFTGAFSGTSTVGASFTDASGNVHTSNQVQVIFQGGVIGRVPSPPTAVHVIPLNGSAIVSWKPPGNSGSFAVDAYIVTATPIANDRVPAPSAAPISQMLPSTVTVTTLHGLVADCHQTYDFSVTARNAAGLSAPRVAGGGPHRPSGNLIPNQSGDPPLVVLLVDGKGYSGSTSIVGGNSYNPLKPTTSGPFTYCPEMPWDGVSAQAATPFQPALQDFLGEADQRGWNWRLPPVSFFTGNGPLLYTHSFMLDPLAAIGAVVLPYGYPSGPASLARLPNGNPNFAFPGYTVDNNSDPYAEAATLAAEVQQIHSVWRTSRLVVIGHSHGGLVAYLFWGGAGVGPGVGALGVTNIFSLDSPINGIAACAVGSGFPFCLTKTGQLYSQLWRSATSLDGHAIQNDGDQSFTPIGTEGDTNAFGPEEDLGTDGIFSQILFNCSGGVFGFEPTCNPAYPPDVNSPNCAITAGSTMALRIDTHDAVRICPDYVATIARGSGVPAP